MDIFSPLRFLLALALPALLLAAKPNSTSTSRQFIVFGADIPGRGALCDLAERTKSNLLHLLNQPDQWKTLLLINVAYPQSNFPDAPREQLELSQLGFGLKLQLNLFVTRDLLARNVQREILRAILIEWIYRDRASIGAGTPYISPPDWLVDGLLSLEPGRLADNNAEILQTVVDTNKIASLEEVVKQPRSQLDCASRRLFDAYSQALVQLLLDSPNGQEKLVQYLVDLPLAPGDVLADLRAHFPETLGRAPDKWWSLSVAQLSASDRHEVLTAAETGRQLDRLLRFPITSPDGRTREYSPGDYAKFCKLPGYANALGRAARQLLLLSALAHPSYHAILQENYEIIELLMQGQTKRIDDRLDRVRTNRATIERQVSKIDDYLNWFEATQQKSTSGAFTEILKNAETDEQTRPKRHDPISVYLDSIEMEMQ